jgi:hypothetical protein
MATQTTNYNLIKQGQEDYYNVDILNGNMDLIDAALQEHEEVIEEVNSQLATIADDYTKQIPYAGTTTGAANTYAIAAPAITALTSGMAVCVKIHIASTGASTLNWNGKGAKGIKKSGGADATNLKANGIYTLRYDGTSFILQGEGASGNATASDLLSGKTAATDAGDITGTMPDYRGVDTTPHSVNGVTGGIYVQPKTGAYNQVGAVFVEDPDFVAGNFLATKNMFGLQGSIPVMNGDLNGYTSMNSKIANVWSANTGRLHYPILPGAYLAVGDPSVHAGIDTPMGYIDDPDFVSANFLATKNIFGLQGSIPDRSLGHTQAQSVTSGNGIVYLGPPPGYYNGDNANNNAWVYAAHSDFTPANILAGKSPFGLAGALVPGKKVVSGTASVNGAEFFKYADGSTTSSLYSITVSGLTFTPSLIIIYRNDVGDGYEYNTVYRATGRSYPKIAMLSINSPSVSQVNAYNVRADVAPAYINSTGFKLPVPTNGTFNWTAIE